MDFVDGLSKNMRFIAQIEAARRKTGTKDYGHYVQENDVSKMSAPMEGKEKFVCTICGATIIQPHNGKRRYCDECQHKKRNQYTGSYYKKTKGKEGG